MTGAAGAADGDDEPGLHEVADRHGVEVRSFERDGAGWRWRVAWRGIEAGAWNDMDGVAVVADIGPADSWVGLRGHPVDPDEGAALEWALATLGPWLAVAANAQRVGDRPPAGWRTPPSQARAVPGG